MQSQAPLFRRAAVEARRSEGLGTIVLTRPVSFVVLTGVLGTVVVALAALVYFGSYTAHSTLRGRIVPDRGVISVTSPQSGMLVEKRVVEGQHVAAGDPLYVVSSERLSSASGATQAAIAAQLARRRASLVAQIESTRELERAERASLAQRLAGLRDEAAELDEALAAQTERSGIAAATAERFARLRERGFVAAEQSAVKRAELLEQRARLEGLQRERAGLARLKAELDGRAAALGPTYANELAELERAMAATDLEIAENDARRGVVVIAPRAGTVTGVVGQVGQPVEHGTPLGFIVPNDAVLIAELEVPSRAVGLLAAGDAVRLRYAAFPHQKFGQAHGTVASISQATLAATDAPAPGLRGEPVYRVLVTLDSQTMPAYGQPRRLLPGMAVEADVLLETRRLYEWAFEPLYALGARLR
jgi:membrane fusion protein